MTDNKRKRKIDGESRKFNAEWESKYFFVEYNEKLLCLICNEDIKVMKEYNVKRHYNTRHEAAYQEIQGKLRTDKLEKLKINLQKQQDKLRQGSAQASAVVEASYVVSHLIAQHSKPYTDGEFVKKCMVKVAGVLCPKEKEKFTQVSLSNVTVADRIDELADDIHRQLGELAKNFIAFSLAFDESKDIQDTEQLSIFIRGVDENLVIVEELLDLISLHDTTKGEDVFLAVMEAMEKIELPLTNLVSVTADGAPAMKSPSVGCIARIKNRAKQDNAESDIISYHCIIHQQALCSKILSMDSVVKCVVKIINFIKAKGLNHRQFKTLLEDLDSDYADVRLHTEVRWLSRGFMLARFYELLDEISLFMELKGEDTSNLKDPQWLSDLAFMVDLTGHLNVLNKQLQGRNKIITNMISDVKSFETKLRLFKAQLLSQNLFHFAKLKDVCEKHPDFSIPCATYANKVGNVISEFENRFQECKEHKDQFDLFANPFNIDAGKVPEKFQLELIDIQNSEQLKGKYNEVGCPDFYKYVEVEKYLLRECYLCSGVRTSVNLCFLK